MMNKEQIQKLTDQEDIPGLCALVNEASQGTVEGRGLLNDSITQILEIWLMDFDTHKGGDPNDYPFLDGVKALEDLGISHPSETQNYRAFYLIQCSDYFSRKGEMDKAREKAIEVETFLQKSLQGNPQIQSYHASHLIQCSDYFSRKGEIDKAREKAVEAEIFLQESLKKNSQIQSLYGYLINLYQDFPSKDFSEREAKFSQAIDLSHKVLPLSNHFLSRQLRIFFRKNEFPSLEPRLIQERQIWITNATRAAEQDPLLALELSKSCLSLMKNSVDPDDSRHQSSRQEQELAQVLSLLAKLALKGCPNAFQTDPISFAHDFMRLGKALQKEIFFEAAQNLYAGHSIRVAAARNKTPRHITTYEINAKEERARLLEKNGSSGAAEEFRRQNIDSYLLEWRNYQNDISYLSHAMEYLLDRIFSFPPERRPQSLLTEVRDISLAAEKIGGGHYWFPYVGLFWSYAFLGQDDDAKLWLGRGYFSLTILIEDQLKKLSELAQEKAPRNMIEFISRLQEHYDKIPDKTFWPGPPPRQEILQTSLIDILKKLETSPR